MEALEEKSGIFLVRKKIIPANSVAHIIQRAPGKELLFIEKADHLYFLKLLKETSAKYNFEVLCFALLSNHFHLLIRFLQDNASYAIKNLCERYAWFFNIKYKRKGHVFYGSFRAGLCLDDSYLLTSSLYIHLNPVKANLVSHPSLYPWSSYSLYSENRNPKTFVNYNFILVILDGDIRRARKIYTGLITRSLRIKLDSALENPKVLRTLHRSLMEFFFTLNKPFRKNDFLTNTLLEKKLKEFSRLKRLRTPQERKARQYLVQQMLHSGYTLGEIAEKLNLARRTVYAIIAPA